MDREIKFRCFDLETKAMNYWDLDHYDKENHDCYGNCMQFTGRKDKNGKEIYEGDIVKSAVEFDDGGWDVHVGTVTYDNANCGYYCHSLKNELSRSLGGIKRIYEVIGNIHENPELCRQS